MPFGAFTSSHVYLSRGFAATESLRAVSHASRDTLVPPDGGNSSVPPPPFILRAESIDCTGAGDRRDDLWACSSAPPAPDEGLDGSEDDDAPPPRPARGAYVALRGLVEGVAASRVGRAAPFIRGEDDGGESEEEGRADIDPAADADLGEGGGEEALCVSLASDVGGDE